MHQFLILLVRVLMLIHPSLQFLRKEPFHISLVLVQIEGNHLGIRRNLYYRYSRQIYPVNMENIKRGLSHFDKTHLDKIYKSLDVPPLDIRLLNIFHRMTILVAFGVFLACMGNRMLNRNLAVYNQLGKYYNLV